MDCFAFALELRDIVAAGNDERLPPPVTPAVAAAADIGHAHQLRASCSSSSPPPKPPMFMPPVSPP
jgi:hypothetical protein